MAAPPKTWDIYPSKPLKQWADMHCPMDTAEGKLFEVKKEFLHGTQGWVSP